VNSKKLTKDPNISQKVCEFSLVSRVSSWRWERFVEDVCSERWSRRVETGGVATMMNWLKLNKS